MRLRTGSLIVLCLGCCATAVRAQTSGTLLPLSTAPNVWLNAGSGVTTAGTAVTTWVDQSGNSGRNATQGDGNLRPTFVSASGNFAGQPTLQFDGNGFLDGLWTSSSAGQASVFVAYRLGTVPGPGNQVPVMAGITSQGQGLGLSWHVSGGHMAFVWASVDALVAGSTTAAVIQSAAVSGSGLTTFLNGRVATAGGANVNLASSYRVGRTRSSQDPFPLTNGSEVAEIIMFDTALSSGDQTTTNNYLSGKYGIATESSRLWTGGSTDVGSASNWGGSLAAGDQLVFRGTGQTSPTVDSNRAAAGIAFSGVGTAGSFTLSGSGTVSIGANGVANWSNASQTIAAALDLTSTAAWNVVGDLAVSGPVSGSGGLTKAGGGTLRLSGGNSFAGGTTVGGGTLVAASTTALGSGPVTIAAGATVRLADYAAVANTFTGDGSLLFAGGGIKRTSGAGLATQADILAGTALAPVSLAPATTWRARELGTTFSDIVDVTNVGSSVRILQLSYDPSILGLTPESDLLLGWKNGSDWVNAIDGLVPGGSAQTDRSGSLAALGIEATSAYLGSWGRDPLANTVWAVVDHNSEFAVIAVPEPATGMLAGVVLAGAVASRWRRSAARTDPRPNPP